MKAVPLVVSLSLLVGCGGHARPYPDAPVILISIDTLRADHLRAYGYTKVQTPAIDALQRDSILFENAYSHCPLTLPSHLSMLTGPAAGRARREGQPRLPLRRPGSQDPGRDVACAGLRHGGCGVELRAARRHRHQRLPGLLRRRRGRRRRMDAGQEPAPAPGRRDRSSRSRLGRRREDEAVLPLPAPLRAAPAPRAARAVPDPLRGDLRRRGGGERRRGRRVPRAAQARRPLRPRDHPAGLGPWRRPRGPRRAGARNPALSRGPPRPASAEASGLAGRRSARGGAGRTHRHRAHDHESHPPGRAQEGKVPSRSRPGGRGSARECFQRNLLPPDPPGVEPFALADEREPSLHRRAEARALRSRPRSSRDGRHHAHRREGRPVHEGGARSPSRRPGSSEPDRSRPGRAPESARLSLLDRPDERRREAKPQRQDPTRTKS